MSRTRTILAALACARVEQLTLAAAAGGDDTVARILASSFATAINNAQTLRHATVLLRPGGGVGSAPGLRCFLFARLVTDLAVVKG